MKMMGWVGGRQKAEGRVRISEAPCGFNLDGPVDCQIPMSLRASGLLCFNAGGLIPPALRSVSCAGRGRGERSSLWGGAKRRVGGISAKEARMGGTKRYPSIAVCEYDGFRKGLTPSYGLVAISN